MRNVVRRGRGAQDWRDLMARQAQSGLSVQAFCLREGLNAWTFYGWRSRLRARGAEAQPVVSGSATPEGAAGFINLGTLESAASRCEIRLDLGGGVVLQVVRG
ncbi:MAG: IS66 family insertion sequence element accessory protein TnpA [Steroidobacteraceae bacterium]